jgi:hypothetical protein
MGKNISDGELRENFSGGELKNKYPYLGVTVAIRITRCKVT